MWAGETEWAHALAGDQMGAGLRAERKALWRESDTVPEAGIHRTNK